jgi:hypothetical protein
LIAVPKRTRRSAISALREQPSRRRLRGYTFDPSLSLIIDTFEINNIVYRVRWEREEDGFGEGPVGEYVEVVDYDPTVRRFYPPVDLNDLYILANDGLDPSESNPQFHQQMVYAVAMLTIENFERALGRKILWAPRLLADRKKYEEYVGRLRIYPHALREANAYYSPLKKAVLFGYFAAAPQNPGQQMPGSLVFTCLSHDIIAHEVTHAILDGLHRHYNQPTNADVLAFHEAFADLVALFQHFSFPDVLKHQIAQTQGDLEKQNLLGELAQQFGVAIGNYGSLRDALGEIDEETGEWRPKKPEPMAYRHETDPHARGSILVAAVFEAFLTIYKHRVRDLLRIATGGTGIPPAGELHPDLVNRLANEAAKTAEHVLRMCIRAIDYCPPVDINFGDYLRALITADRDLVRGDEHHYRLAFINAFRSRGIYPEGIKTLSEHSLCYERQEIDKNSDTGSLFAIIADFLKAYRAELMYETDRQRIYETSRDFITGRSGKQGGSGIFGLHRRLLTKFDNSYEFEKLSGLVFNGNWASFGVPTAGSGKGPSFQILNLRLVSRVGPDGEKVNQIVFGLVQRMGVVFKDGKFVEHYVPGTDPPPPGGFETRGGCTMIFDLDSVELKYAISKPLFKAEALDERRHEVDLERIGCQHRYRYEELPLNQPEVSKYFGTGVESGFGEPFSLLHSRSKWERKHA